MKTLELCSIEELDIEKTFECGQCFRWNADENGVYWGVVRGFPAKVWEEDGKVCVRSDAPAGMWRDYFDLDRDYEKTTAEFTGISEYLNRCIEYGRGIRILRQEPWEAICSFIISQCNNISRIKGIVERLCALYGEETAFEGRKMYTFPGAEVLACATEEDLASLRSGYRAAYIITAAKSVASGETKPEELIACHWREAEKALMSLKGIGKKVADCAVLFGLYHMEAFPVDVWIKKALKEHFPTDFVPESLGPCAGLAQQYIFYYARSTGNAD